MNLNFGDGMVDIIVGKDTWVVVIISKFMTSLRSRMWAEHSERTSCRLSRAARGPRGSGYTRVV